MEKFNINTLKIILGIISGFLLGVAFVCLWVDINPKRVTMIQSWHDEDQSQIDVRLGNGLDDAIQKCAEHDGLTSLEGSTTQRLTCIVGEETYVYREWEWESYEPLKLK